MPEQQPPVGNAVPVEKTKICPHCRKEISVVADKCPFCQSSDLRTKLCRYCKQIVPKKAKECPVCQKDSRGSWWRRHWFFVGFVMFVILMILIGSGSQNNSATEQNVAVQNSNCSIGDCFKQIANTVLAGKVRTVEVFPVDNGEYKVNIDFNADVSSFGMKAAIEKDIADTDIALYTSHFGKNIAAVGMAAYLPGTDKYGNQVEGVFYRAILEKSNADKVNWSSDKFELETRILPPLWISLVNPNL